MLLCHNEEHLIKFVSQREHSLDICYSCPIMFEDVGHVYKIRYSGVKKRCILEFPGM